MATAPTFFGNIMVGRLTLGTANAARDGTGTLGTPLWMGSGVAGADTAFTAGAPTTDWQLNSITIAEDGDLAASMVTVFTTDGSTIKFWTDYQLSNPSAGSATVTGVVQESFLSAKCFPKNCDLRFGLTATPTSGLCVVTIFAERA